jgi:hypothetical protein
MTQGLHDSESLPQVTQLDYDASGNVIYAGVAPIGSSTSQAVWQIRKFTYSAGGNLLNCLWANGSSSFNNIWNNRTALAYS